MNEETYYTGAFVKRVASRAVVELFSWLERKNKNGSVVLTADALNELSELADAFEINCLYYGGSEERDGVITESARRFEDVSFFFLKWLNSWCKRGFYTDEEMDALTGYITIMCGGTIGGRVLTEDETHGSK